MERDLNRIKIVLAEKKRTNKWLAAQLGKDPATVSKWCTNAAQPGLDTLNKIAEVFSNWDDYSDAADTIYSYDDDDDDNQEWDED